MRKRYFAACVAMSMLLSLAGCSQTTTQQTSDSSNTTVSTDTTTDTSETNSTSDDTADSSASGTIDLSLYDLSTSDRDADASYEESTATVISFSESSVEVDGDNVTVDGTSVTITGEGTYLIRGECSDGQILVAADDAKVQLVLDGLTLSSSTSPLVVESADKVFLTLADGSENILSDASDYTLTVDDSDVDAVIFSKDDLTINGTGTLVVNGQKKHGIVSKDDLVITGGNLQVTAVSCAINGKDNVRITGGVFTLQAGTDGIRSDNDEEEELGYIFISDGTFAIAAENDGIQAETVCVIEGGKFAIASGGGSENAAAHTESFWTTSENEEESESTKGIKAGTALVLTGGNFTIDSADDSVHSNGSITIDNVTLVCRSGDDGVHADNALTVNSGTITVEESYEGLEAGTVTINDGTIDITASDDGINAAGGSDEDSSGTNTGGRWDMFDVDATKHIIFNGGYVVVNASGDGLDSNGDITINDGVVLVSGPTDNANGSLDCGTEITINGGVLVAVGSSGMAEGVSSDTQASIYTNLSSTVEAGTSVTLCTEDGTVLASFTPQKRYQNVIISTPEMTTDTTYVLVTGATVENTDSYGYAAQSACEGGTSTEVTASLSSASSGGMGMGGQPMGGGMPQQQPTGESFSADDMPQMPDGESFSADDVPQMPDGESFSPGEKRQRPNDNFSPDDGEQSSESSSQELENAV